jgi:ABC-type multidrug transport system fused ATPase/permease subunit
MESSFFSLLIFTLITLVYYLLLKPKLNVSAFDDPTGAQYTAYSSSNNTAVLIYFLFVVLTQMGINASVMVTKCGGSLMQNIGSAFLMTLIPWIFIFGGVIICLIMFPGFKSAFSNVIGYFAVSNSANNILSELLVNTDLNQTINAAKDADPTKINSLKSAAEAIIKLCGNMSILINQIVPSNFVEYWAMLLPLMKEQYQSGAPELKQQLLDAVVVRDNVGEALWYIYAAVLLISITQYNIMSRPCNKDLVTLQESQDLYLKTEKKINADSEKQKSTIYTL